MENIVRIDEEKFGSLAAADPDSVLKVFDQIKYFGFAPMKLNGFEHCLFQTHLAFQTAQKQMDKPIMGASVPLMHYTNIPWDIEREYFKIKLTPLSLLITSLQPSNSTEEQDLEMLRRVLECFVDLPVVSYKRLYLESGSDKPLVGGKLDLLVGSKLNGNKPAMLLSKLCGRETLCKVYLGSICEAKATSVTLMPKVTPSTYEDETYQNKTFIQPMLEVMSFSEKCDFSESKIPLVNIFGSRNTFRPLLYFKAYDVLLTTPTAITYRNRDESINLCGLVLLHILFNLHNYPFSHDILSQQFKTGWEQAKVCTEPYKDSYITNEEIKVSMDKNIVNPYIHSPMKEAVMTKLGKSSKKQSGSDESRGQSSKKRSGSDESSHGPSSKKTKK